MGIEKFLVRCANEASYYSLDPEKLERLYRLSASFVDSGYKGIPSTDYYTILEQHFYLSILTENDNAAKLTLQRIIDKFGPEPNRVSALRTVYAQITMTPEKFEEFLENNGKDDTSLKQRFVGLKTDGKWTEYTAKLVAHLDDCPTDGEAWSELGEAYAISGNFPEALKAYSQVLVLYPYAYNIFARIGELLHSQASTVKGGIETSIDQMAESIANFCRSVELCPTYIRGWAGLFVVTTKLVQWPKVSEKEVYLKLNVKAKAKLEVLAQTGNPLNPDVAAAKEILS